MYVPKNLTMSPYYQEAQFIRDYPFATLVSTEPNKQLPLATHIPFIIEENKTGHPILYSHLAKANPQWKSLAEQQVLIIFQGPHAYIFPTYYQSSPNVPTWNYAAVHVYAQPKLLSGQQAISVMEKTVASFEPNANTNMDKTFQQKLMKAIAIFEFEVIKIEGKLKLGQHKNEADQESVYHQLIKSKSTDANQLAAFMFKTQCGIGN